MMTLHRGQAWRAGKLTYTATEIIDLAREYYAYCEDNNRRATVEGLAAHMGISSKTLKAWAKDEKGKNPEAADAVKKCMDIITDDLQQGKTSMDIFRLKQPIYGGYVDKVEQQQSGNITITVQGGKGLSWGK